MKKLLSLFLCLIFASSLMAQEEIPMADLMRSNGKIYVVVGVLVIIFVGLVIYMIRLDRRITELEKKNQK